MRVPVWFAIANVMFGVMLVSAAAWLHHPLTGMAVSGAALIVLGLLVDTRNGTPKQ